MTTRYTITILERDYKTLQDFLFQDCEVERAAFLRCGLSTTNQEVRFLVKGIHLMSDDDLNYATADSMSIKSTTFMPVLKLADSQHEAIIFVHSHTCGAAFFSKQDDATEPDFFRTVFNRIADVGNHGSVVFSDEATFAGRVWFPNGKQSAISSIRIIGNRWRFLYSKQHKQPNLSYFDRQIRAFGPDIQSVLSQLHVGVVGAGGTGSAVIEQLIRLGIGKLTVFDNQLFELSNINRVYNSRVVDEGESKLSIVQRSLAEAGLNTTLEPVQEKITSEAAAKKLRDCDFIFGCTDDQYGRSILNSLALRYLVPVVDMGIKIHSRDGQITHINGRVTFLQPGNTCLHCRKRLDTEQIRYESMHPEELERLRGQGYAPELEDPAPAVIAFTTGIAANAISEFLNRFIGFVDEEYVPSELIYAFHSREILRPSSKPRAGCECQNEKIWGVGDTRLFLGMTWSV
jgi:molybdopterin/thiamine biosynthesis adenylyltransferase